VGTYGTLTLNTNGSYSYAADQSAADDLKKGETGSDVFTYTVSDGTDTDTATLTINVLGLDEKISVLEDERKELTKKNHTITALPKTLVGQVLPANFIVNQDSFFADQVTEVQTRLATFKSVDSLTPQNDNQQLVAFKSIDSLNDDTTQPSEEFIPFQSIESLSGTEDNLEAHNFIPLSQQVEQEMDEWNHYGEKVLAHLG
jgi:VCBS repeat-containing protein